jgi:D,D-heptose 1,7-bisphosphate phosphatase
MPNVAVFFDRDGVLNEEVSYVTKVSELAVYPFAAEAVRRVNETGMLAIVVTNQAGIARGLLSEAALEDIHAKLEEILKLGRARLDAIYYCPHHPDYGPSEYRQACSCRKPNPGMLLAAARDYQIDLTRSFFITDRHREIAMAQAAGLRGVLVLTGYGRAEQALRDREEMPRPDLVADNVLTAVRAIVSGIPAEAPAAVARE